MRIHPGACKGACTCLNIKHPKVRSGRRNGLHEICVGGNKAEPGDAILSPPRHS